MTIYAVTFSGSCSDHFLPLEGPEKSIPYPTTLAWPSRQATNTLTSAKTPREAVEQFVELMVDDPVRGRVLLLAPTVEPILTQSGADWMPNFIDLLQRKLSRIVDSVLQKMIATSLVGGLTSLFTAYLNGQLGATRKQFIDYCVSMLFTAAAPYVAPAEPGKSE